MVVLPPTFLVSGAVVQSSVLPKLKKVSGIRACRFCLHPQTICGCGQIPSWSLPLTGQSLATVTMAMAHLHSSTSVSASTKCPPPGLPPHGGTTTTSTYLEVLTFTPPPQTQMRGVSCPPLPGGRYPAVDLHSGAPNPRMEAPIRQEHPITWQNEPRTPYQQQVKVPSILTTWSSGVGRGALKELVKKRSKELECQTATVGQGQGLSSKTQGVGATSKKHEEAPDQGQQGQVRGRS